MQTLDCGRRRPPQFCAASRTSTTRLASEKFGRISVGVLFLLFTYTSAGRAAVV